MWKARLASVAIGLLYVAAARHLEIDPMDHYGYFVFTFIAVCLIWFPEQLGSVRGVGIGGLGGLGGGTGGIAAVDKETPGCVVSAFGWLLLIGVPLAWLAMRDVPV